MIMLKIMGGFGNQMFQYAFARELLYRGKEVKADISYYADIPAEDTERNIIKEKLFADLPIAKDEEIRFFLRENSKLKWKLMRRMKIFRSHEPVCYQKKSYWYDDKVFDKKHAYLVGWWQNEQYFVHVKDVIRAEYLNGIKRLNEQSESTLEKMRMHRNSVSIHVRGGDYNNISNHAVFGGICGKEYYKKAIGLLKEQFTETAFYVFTNDPEYAIEVLPKGELYEIVVNSEADGCQDIFLMSRCKHHIIANSTFSWWGAWLDPNEEKIVIAPQCWNRNVHETPNCSGWTII